MPELFTPNREEITAKVIDGELIIIRLSDGTYYSMDNIGTRVWELLEGNYDVAALVDVVASAYKVARERVETDVGSLVRDLLAERLVVATNGDAARQVDPGPPPETLAYETPRLNIYRDMGNLLALDPPTPGIDELLFDDDKDR